MQSRCPEQRKEDRSVSYESKVLDWLADASFSVQPEDYKCESLTGEEQPVVIEHDVVSVHAAPRPTSDAYLVLIENDVELDRLLVDTQPETNLDLDFVVETLDPDLLVPGSGALPNTDIELGVIRHGVRCESVEGYAVLDVDENPRMADSISVGLTGETAFLPLAEVCFAVDGCRAGALTQSATLDQPWSVAAGDKPTSVLSEFYEIKSDRSACDTNRVMDLPGDVCCVLMEEDDFFESFKRKKGVEFTARSLNVSSIEDERVVMFCEGDDDGLFRRSDSSCGRPPPSRRRAQSPPPSPELGLSFNDPLGANELRRGHRPKRVPSPLRKSQHYWHFVLTLHLLLQKPCWWKTLIAISVLLVLLLDVFNLLP